MGCLEVVGSGGGCRVVLQRRVRIGSLRGREMNAEAAVEAAVCLIELVLK